MPVVGLLAESGQIARGGRRMIVLTQIPLDYLDESGDDDGALALRAQEVGAELFYVPQEKREPEHIEESFAQIPVQPHARTAVWKGTIPSFAYYTQVYERLAARRIFLINEPQAHRQIFEFDLAYPLLADLTPRTVVIESPQQAQEAVQELGLPVFVKGAMLSLKHKDWSDCIAESVEELASLTARLLAAPYFSRGRVLVRELVPLRKQVVGASDIPAGREFRLFVYRGAVMGCGYYWPYLLPFSTLSQAEEEEVFALAKEAAGRLEAPFVSLDIGQLEDDRWIVIETGDPQFSGLSLMSSREMWSNLLKAIQGQS